MNMVKATGILINKNTTEGYKEEITLLIKRPREWDAKVRFVLDTPMDPDIDTGTVVDIEGYLHGFNKRDENGKWKVMQYLVATQVTKGKSVLEKTFGVKGHFPPEQFFRIYIEGRISMVVQTANEWKKLGVRIPGVNRIDEATTIDLRYSPRTRNEFESIKRGDVIQAYLNIKTSSKIIDGVETHFEDIFVEDLVITKKVAA